MSRQKQVAKSFAKCAFVAGMMLSGASGGIAGEREGTPANPYESDWNTYTPISTNQPAVIEYADAAGTGARKRRALQELSTELENSGRCLARKVITENSSTPAAVFRLAVGMNVINISCSGSGCDDLQYAVAGINVPEVLHSGTATVFPEIRVNGQFNTNKVLFNFFGTLPEDYPRERLDRSDSRRTFPEDARVTITQAPYTAGAFVRRQNAGCPHRSP